jgi:hypothetical protein
MAVWKALEQAEVWARRDQDTGHLAEVRLIDMDPAHLMRLRDWLLRNATGYAPAGHLDPESWMKQRPLWIRVNQMVERPGQAGELIAEIFTADELHAIGVQLRRSMKNRDVSDSQKPRVRRVLWKIKQLEARNA